MDKLPLIRVVEVAFLTTKLQECAEFYRKIGMNDLSSDPQRLNFANVGEQLFGFCDQKIGFIDGNEGYTKAPLHIAFQIPYESLDECVSFLNSKGIETSRKNDGINWHGATRSISVYFSDPAGSILELWTPSEDFRGSGA